MSAVGLLPWARFQIVCVTQPGPKYQAGRVKVGNLCRHSQRASFVGSASANRVDMSSDAARVGGGHAGSDAPDASPGVEPGSQRPKRPVIRRTGQSDKAKCSSQEWAALIEHALL